MREIDFKLKFKVQQLDFWTDTEKAVVSCNLLQVAIGLSICEVGDSVHAQNIVASKQSPECNVHF